MNTELIRMFKVATAKGKMVDPVTLNIEALKRGYVVNPKCCTECVMDFILEENIDYNATFYKDWSDVTDKSRVELFVDQILHYFVSYGMGGDWIPNEGSVPPAYKIYKVIDVIEEKVLYKRCYDVLCTNVALKQNTVKALCEFIAEYVKATSIKFNIDNIQNKEANAILCKMFDIAPSDKFDLLRYIVYKTIGKSTLIKDNGTIMCIRCSQHPFDFTTLGEKQLVELSSIFYRYKDIFLAFKHNDWVGMSHIKNSIKNIVNGNKKVINKLRRMAEKNHKPFYSGFWEIILDGNRNFTEYYIRERVEKDNVSNFKLVQLIQAINDRILVAGGVGKHLYIIRNGKTWLKETNIGVVDSKIFYWEDIRKILERILIERLSKKACVVKFPKDLKLACPTSEKNFVGDIPFGSYYDMKDNSFFGMYWRNEWGARDLDLSFIDNDSNKIGWNANYNSGDIVYSGDRTNADDGASEVILVRKNCRDGIININAYNSDDLYRYKFFFGTGNVNTKNWGPGNKPGYMVNPNHIKVQTDCEGDRGQQMVGLVTNNRAYVMNFGVAGGMVSRSNPDIFEAMKRKTHTFVDLRDILLKAGFEDYDNINLQDPYNENVEIELDLSNLNRDTLISLFS